MEGWCRRVLGQMGGGELVQKGSGAGGGPDGGGGARGSQSFRHFQKLSDMEKYESDKTP